MSISVTISSSNLNHLSDSEVAAYEIRLSLVGSEMCIRDSVYRVTVFCGHSVYDPLN